MRRQSLPHSCQVWVYSNRPQNQAQCQTGKRQKHKHCNQEHVGRLMQVKASTHAGLRLVQSEPRAHGGPMQAVRRAAASLLGMCFEPRVACCFGTSSCTIACPLHATTPRTLRPSYQSRHTNDVKIYRAAQSSIQKQLFNARCNE